MGDFGDRLSEGYAKQDKYAPKTRVPENSILQEAYDLTHGDRQAAYGHPDADFKATGRMWAAKLERWLGSEGYALVHATSDTEELQDWEDASFPDIPPRMVAIMLPDVKGSREAAKPKHDNRVDAIGYWECANRIVEGEDK